jgi:hypothetical protein
MSDSLAKVESTPSQFLAGIGHLQPVDAFPDDWDIEKKEKAAAELTKRPIGSRMYQTIPRICHSNDCTDREQGLCDLTYTPDGARCPYEKKMLDMLLEGFLKELATDDDEDFQISVFSLARDYIDVELQIMRLQGEFSKDPSFTIEQDIYGKDGDIVTTQIVESPLQLSYDRLGTRKQKILKQLAVTREQRLKLNGDNVSSTNIARVASVMSRIANHLETAGQIDRFDPNEEIVDAFIDADYEIITPEETPAVPIDPEV